MVQLVAGPRTPVQPLNGRPKLLVTVTPVNVTLKLPVLATVMFWVLLVVPSTCGSNAREAGVTTRVSACATPVPERVTFAGLPGALCVIVSVAERAPLAAGVKVMPMVQVLPTGPCCNGLGQLLVRAKSEAFVPLRASEEIATGAVPVFV